VCEHEYCCSLHLYPNAAHYPFTPLLPGTIVLLCGSLPDPPAHNPTIHQPEHTHPPDTENPYAQHHSFVVRAVIQPHNRCRVPRQGPHKPEPQYIAEGIHYGDDSIVELSVLSCRESESLRVFRAGV
jgi:hypothetical protein